MKMKTYVLVDRSGSMSTHWAETVNALTEFANGIKGKLHVAMFDRPNIDMEYLVIHDDKAKNYNGVGSIQPRGMTPLYDAVGKLSAVINADKPSKAQIVIMTDGHENASREFKREAVKNIITEWEKLSFDVIWMGASFDEVYGQAGSVGLNASKTVNVKSASDYSATMTSMATRNVAFASGTVEATDALDDDTRKAAGEK